MKRRKRWRPWLFPPREAENFRARWCSACRLATRCVADFEACEVGEDPRVGVDDGEAFVQRAVAESGSPCVEFVEEVRLRRGRVVRRGVGRGVRAVAVGVAGDGFVEGDAVGERRS